MLSKSLLLLALVAALVFTNQLLPLYAQGDAESAGEQDAGFSGAPPDFNLRPFCWMEFKCKDNERTGEFYEEVFGWKISPYEEMETYYFFQPKSGLMGGFNSDLPEGFQDTIAYIYVPDIDAALAEIEQAGGKTAMPKMPVGDWGHIAFFNDPSGVLMGISDMYMPADEIPYPFGEGEKPEENTICFFEVFAGEKIQDSSTFYSDVFGWKTAAVEGHTGKVVFSPGAGAQGVFLHETDGIPLLAYIWVEDVAATLAMIEQAGGEILYGSPIVAPHVGVFGYFKDPSGVIVGLLGER